MYLTYLKLIFLLINFGSSQKVQDRNLAKKNAKVSFEKHDYKSAIFQLDQIQNSTFNYFSEVNLNAANCYLALNQNEEAFKKIKLIENISEPTLKPRILNTLGCIALRQNDTLKALSFFKSNLKLNSDDQISSYNFELLSKSYTKKNSKNLNNNKKEDSKKINSNGNSSSISVEKNNKKEVDLPRKEKTVIAENGALNLLNAMRESEIQFIQQLTQNQNLKSTNRKKW